LAIALLNLKGIGTRYEFTVVVAPKILARAKVSLSAGAMELLLAAGKPKSILKVRKKTAKKRGRGRGGGRAVPVAPLFDEAEMADGIEDAGSEEEPNDEELM